MKINILNIGINKIGLEEILAKISEWLSSDGQRYIATVNPEFVLAAQKNEEFKKVLNEADLAICDGAGLVWAGRFLRGEKLIRVTGVDLAEELLHCHIATLSHYQFFLLGGAEGVAQAVKNIFPDSPIVGAQAGGRIDENTYLLDNNDELIRQINAGSANILLVAFGQVKQEMWISKNLAKMPGVKVAIGVGGTFDYLSGKVKRAPETWRRLGLEWLYRLMREPRRFGRIWNATIVFGWRIIKQKFLISNF
ncbi:MAG: WecB/TagA/CpsF family glycosyltransferase [Patescibacteria group bacterium]